MGKLRQTLKYIKKIAQVDLYVIFIYLCYIRVFY